MTESMTPQSIATTPSPGHTQRHSTTPSRTASDLRLRIPRSSSFSMQSACPRLPRSLRLRTRRLNASVLFWPPPACVRMHERINSNFSPPQDQLTARFHAHALGEAAARQHPSSLSQLSKLSQLVQLVFQLS